MQLTDSYDQIVETDQLVVLDVAVLPKTAEVAAEDIGALCEVDWWEVKGHEGIILIRAEDARDLTETDPIDAGITFDADTKLCYIAQSLHRFECVHDSITWYHA